MAANHEHNDCKSDDEDTDYECDYFDDDDDLKIKL